MINPVVESARPATTPAPERKAVLPSYRTLVAAAAIPGIAAAALALLTNHLAQALGVFSGLLICLLMYAGIYSFVNGAATTLAHTIGGRAGVDSKGFMPLFALTTTGKFILIGALLYVMFRLLHVNLIGFAAGFIVAQVAITLACIRNLTANPLIEPNR